MELKVLIILYLILLCMFLISIVILPLSAILTIKETKKMWKYQINKYILFDVLNNLIISTIQIAITILFIVMTFHLILELINIIKG